MRSQLAVGPTGPRSASLGPCMTGWHEPIPWLPPEVLFGRAVNVAWDWGGCRGGYLGHKLQ